MAFWRHLLLLSFVFAAALCAQPRSAWALHEKCQRLKLPCRHAERQLWDVEVALCKQQMSGWRCDGFKNDSSLAPYIRVCTPEVLCEEQEDLNAAVRGCTGVDAQKLPAQTRDFIQHQLPKLGACIKDPECSKEGFWNILKGGTLGVWDVISGYGTTVYQIFAHPVETSKHVALGGLQLVRMQSCLNAEYKMHEVCGVGVAVGTIAGAGKAVSAGASKISKSIVKRDVAIETAKPLEVAEKEKPWARAETKSQFVKRMLNYDPTTDAQRVEMMSFVQSSKSRGVLIFDEEFAAAKDLNKTLDKDMVTSLASQRKEILLRKFTEFEKKHSDILTIGPKYSEFKPLRLAIVPKTPAIRATGFPKSVYQDLQKLLDETNQEFDAKLKALGVKSKPSAELFRAGLDSSADEANLNARFAQAGKIARSGDPAILSAKVASYADLRAQGDLIGKSLDSGSPLVEMHSGHAIMKPEIFDVIKKSDKSVQSVQSALKQLYPGVKISDSSVKEMVRCAELTDHFQPGIWSTTRTVASLRDAKYGGISIDVKGMGSHNAHQTLLKALTCTSPSQLVQCTRDGERAVTRDFQARLAKIRDVSMKNCAAAGVKCALQITGDDVKIIPLNKPFAPGYASRNLEMINESLGAGKIRQAEILQGVAMEQRETVVTSGEIIETILARNLSTSSLALKAKDTTFHVAMRTTQAHLGPVEIIPVGPGYQAMTAAEKTELSRQYKTALSEFNAREADAYHLAEPSASAHH